MKKTGLTVASHLVVYPSAIAGKIVSHVELHGASVLTCWHDDWDEYLRRMSLWQFDRVRIKGWSPLP